MYIAMPRRPWQTWWPRTFYSVGQFYRRLSRT